MAPKTHQNRRRTRTSKKELFKTVLGASWGDLGTFSVPSRGHRMHSPCSGVRFFKKSPFYTKWVPRTTLERFWSQLGTNLGAKREPKGTQNGTKIDTKNDQTNHRFWKATRGAMTRAGVNPDVLGPHPSRATTRKTEGQK